MRKEAIEEIVEGLTIDRKGSVTVASGYQQVLCDLSLEMQELSSHPVDVEHVVAAVVMAVRDGRISRGSVLQSENQHQNQILVRYVEILFRKHQGKVGPVD